MKKFVKETGKKLATGALAILATIGGASAATLTPTSGQDFTLTGGSTVDDMTIPVQGYQTSKVYSYELNITWGDMRFIFDRGVYDAANNRLEKKVTTDGFEYCEAGVKADASAASASTTEGVGKWCGFDGSKNNVTVINQGNGNVTLDVSCTEGITGQTLGDEVDMQIAVKTADLGTDADGWAFAGDTVNLTEGQYTYPAKMRDKTGAAADMTIARKGSTFATTTIQKLYNLDGSQNASADRANTVEFFLNITGTPSQTDTSGSSNDNELNTVSKEYAQVISSDWEGMGTINLNFTPAQDAPRTPAIS